MCKLIFFLYLGITLRFDDWEPYRIAAMAVGAIYGARIIFCRILLPRDCSPRDAAIAAIMAPKGLAAAVIAASVAQAGAPNGEAIKSFAYAVVLMSIVSTSLLVPMVELPPMRWLAQHFFTAHRKA
jgi:potassium/hydrogen antiporter